MQYFRYIIQSLSFYWKRHLSVLLATALGTAILTGALIVGDSVNFSLEEIVRQRLGSVVFAMDSGDKMVSAELVTTLGKELQNSTAGVLKTSGLAINPDKDLRVNQVNVYGTDSVFWKFTSEAVVPLERNEVYLSRNLAYRLAIDSGDMLLLRLHVPQTIAVNSPFSQEEETDVAVRVLVKGILSDGQFGRFSLKSDQKEPRNIFFSREYLSKKLKQKGKVNHILVAGKNETNEQKLNTTLVKLWELSDIGLKIDGVGDSLIRLSIEQIFFNETLSKRIQAYEQSSSPVFTYLVNEIRSDSLSTPYSFVTGLEDPSLVGNKIIVNQWLADDLQLSIGDSLTLKYYTFGAFRELEEKKGSFVVAKIEANEGRVFNKALMPDFPGLANANSCSEWDAGVAIDLKRIRDKDEAYWNEFKGTPKAIIHISEAQQMWKNAYGNHTAFFLKGDLAEKTKLEDYLKSSVEPHEVKLNFSAVHKEGYRAANSGVDFGELFLSLSFFVVVAAVLLLTAVYSFNINSRKAELGSLSAIGLKHSQILRLMLGEVIITTFLGVLFGAVLGIVYNRLLISGLNSIWNDAVHADTLKIHIDAVSVMIGALSGFLISIVSLAWQTGKHIKRSVVTVFSDVQASMQGRKRIKLIAIGFSLAAIIALALSFQSLIVMPAIALGIGALFLIAFLLWFAVTLNYWESQEKDSFGGNTLIIKSLARFRGNSISIVAMLAIGVFCVLITGANRNTFSLSGTERSSGTGGFAFWAESTLPILYDLNTTGGREKVGLDGNAVSDSLSFISMHRLAGDDASCLNLNQVKQPTILGVEPEKLSARNAFLFAGTLPDVDEHHPWLFLNQKLGENTYPVFLDQTVITWGIMKSVGDTLKVLSEKGDSINLVIAGGLGASVFQGHMLLGQKFFKSLFPSNGGANLFLIDCKTEQKEEVTKALNSTLQDYGFSLEETSVRLTRFYSVTNTYLDVFMLLGGLALLIGTLGLGVVVSRNLLERKKEFSILQAVGLKQKAIAGYVFAEYFSLLVLGVFIGTVSASVGMIPSFMSEAYSVPLGFVGLLLVCILLSGFLWIGQAVGMTFARNFEQAALHVDV